MQAERREAIGLILVALLVLAFVLLRYGGSIPWGAR
jgi:hypothetical protein